jgi:multiple sugar transport system substrate-binding protein
MSKKVLLPAFVFFLAVGFAFAAPKTTNVVTLRFVHCEGNDKPALIALMKKFQDQNPNIKVNAQYVVNSELKKQMRIAMLSNTMPDLLVFDNPDFSSFAADGYLLDVTDRMAKWGEVDQFQPGPLSSVKYKGRIYGIPWYSNDLALIYNQDMLDKAGVKPPKTWDEVRAAAAKLTGNGVYGLAIAGVKSEVSTFQFIPWLYSAGGSYDKLDSPEAIKALTYLTELIQDKSMSKEVANFAHGDLIKAFEGGRAAMVIQGSWAVWTLKNDVPDLKYGVLPIPSDKTSVTVLGGYNVGISKDCKNVDAAFELLKFLGSKGPEAEYALGTTSIPTRKDAELSAEYKKYPLSVFVNQMPNAVARVNPFWPDLSLNIQVALQEALLGAKTPEQALKDAQAKNADYWK